ncbi:MAG: thermonuclease family protein [Xanthobacteraceae bacterium]|nr:thermonuclease family protein [Xanthobacteraceae bacterium]
MYPTRRIYPFRPRPSRGGWALVLPWIFVIGVAAGTMLPGLRHWRGERMFPKPAVETQADRDTRTVLSHAESAGGRHAVDVLRTIDGDTFEARVHLWPGLDMVTRVRLRGIDAPELKATCADEFRMAQAASLALRALLAEGEVTIFNIGPDKYSGRVVADAATRRTPNVSEALLRAGQVRRYNGGHRGGWC